MVGYIEKNWSGAKPADTIIKSVEKHIESHLALRLPVFFAAIVYRNTPIFTVSLLKRIFSKNNKAHFFVNFQQK